MAVVTPTDRPKSVRNRCLIELFVSLYVLSLCPFNISDGVGAYTIGLISSFLSGNNILFQRFPLDAYIIYTTPIHLHTVCQSLTMKYTIEVLAERVHHVNDSIAKHTCYPLHF